MIVKYEYFVFSCIVTYKMVPIQQSCRLYYMRIAYIYTVYCYIKYDLFIAIMYIYDQVKAILTYCNY